MPTVTDKSGTTVFDRFWASPLLAYMEAEGNSPGAVLAPIYVASNRITDIQFDAEHDEVQALVQAAQSGTRRGYVDAALSLVDGTIISECSCPAGRRCEHAYQLALILAYAATTHRSVYSKEFRDFFPPMWAGRKPRGVPGKELLNGLEELFVPAPGAEEGASADSNSTQAPAKRVVRPWWEKFLEAETADARREVLLDAIRKRFPRVQFAWALSDVTWTLMQHTNPVQVLSHFEEALERFARQFRYTLSPPDAGLAEFLKSSNVEKILADIERREAERKLMSWLSEDFRSSTVYYGEGQTVSRATVEVQWVPRTDEDGISWLCFQVLLSTPKIHRGPRTPHQVFHLWSEVQRGARRLPPLQEQFVEWASKLAPINENRYGGRTYAEADATLIPVYDVARWISNWGGERGLLTWEDATRVEFSPFSARLAIDALTQDPAWVVEFPDAPDSSARKVPVKEAQLLVCEAEPLSKGEAAPLYVREGSLLRQVLTPGMPLEVLTALIRMPVVPLEKLRFKPAGMRLVEKLMGTSALPGSVGGLVREVRVRPTVECRYEDDNTFLFTARATSLEEDNAEFLRGPDGAWTPRKKVKPKAAQASLEEIQRQDYEATAEAETAEQQAEPEERPNALTVVPRMKDIEPVESWLSSLIPLSATYTELPDGSVTVRWKATKQAIYGMLDAWHQRPTHVSYLGDQSFQKLIAPRHVSPFNISVEGSGVDWLKVSVEMEEELKGLSAHQVSDALSTTQGPLVMLTGGRVYYRNELEQYKEQAESLAALGLDAAAGQQRVHAMQLASVPQTALAELGALNAGGLQALASQTREIVRDFQGIPPATIDSYADSFLRPYQRQGVDFLIWAAKTFGGGLLADDMGLGKTLQVLAALTGLPAQEGEEKLPTLVICPASVAFNWKREASKFTPEFKVEVIERGASRRQTLEQLHNYDLVVMNYALVRRDIEKLKEQNWKAVVVDEAQAIKNPSSAIAVAVKELNARYRFALTGTPIENRLTDLWSIMDFAVPGYLGSLERLDAQVKTDPEIAHQRLRVRLRPILLRRLKSEVAPELPERIEERKDCKMVASQKTAYLAELKRTRGLLEDSDGADVAGKKRIEILAALMRLREICCDPALIGLPDKGSGKVDELMDLVPPLLEAGHKVLVFSQFVRMLERLNSRLKQAGVRTRMLTGQTTNRQELVDSFENDPEPSVFLLSLKAGGTGLNLVSASYVILFDPWWNPAVEAQAIDRTHRIGQDKTVVAFRLVTEGTIEERILELQEKKLGLVRNVLEEDAFNRSLSREDFEFLLGES